MRHRARIRLNDLLARGLRFAVAIVLCLAPAGARAETYPTRPIRFIVPVPPGGSVDAMARIMGEKLLAKLGQPIVVDNRPGASNAIGIEAVIGAAPDGYTILFGPGSPLIINKLLYPNRPLDPETLQPVSRIATNPVVLVVHPQVPAKTLSEFIAFAKAHPGQLNYASAGDGGVPHLSAQLFQRKAGVMMTKVPYKGVALAMTDLLAGQVDLIFVDISTAIEHIRTGNLRVLGVASERRNSVLPDVPALTEFLPDMIAETWFSMAAPSKTPAAIVHRLSAAAAEAIGEPDVRKRLQEMGNIEAIGSTPAEMADFMRAERERWAGVIRASSAP
jgi:tripartite-type tricarboxylate transporter receptor subunit TctC